MKNIYETFILNLRRACSFLDRWNRKAWSLSLRKVCRQAISAAALLYTGCSIASAYTTVQASSAAPAGIEQSFIAATTNQFQATVITNPLFPGTYQIKLFGPLTNPAILTDSGTYSFVWSQGQQYERVNDVRMITGQNGICDQSQYCQNLSSFTVSGDFTASGSSYTVNLDQATCIAIACQIASDIYEQSFSTPTIVPGQ